MIPAPIIDMILFFVVKTLLKNVNCYATQNNTWALCIKLDNAVSLSHKSTLPSTQFPPFSRVDFLFYPDSNPPLSQFFCNKTTSIKHLLRQYFNTGTMCEWGRSQELKNIWDALSPKSSQKKEGLWFILVMYVQSLRVVKVAGRAEFKFSSPTHWVEFIIVQHFFDGTCRNT